MKKFFLPLIFMLFFTLCAYADVMPAYTTSINHYGIGAALSPHSVLIYQEKNDKSPLVQKIFWNQKGIIACKYFKNDCCENQIFIAFVPSKNIAIFSVEDEDDNWIKICYDQKNLKFGWIKKADGAQFYSWNEFFISYGKKYGMYLYRNVPSDIRRLYAAPEKGSASVDSWQLAKYISPWLVKGNWILAKVVNYDDTTKTGWLRWRTEEGRLLGFVNLK